MGGGGWGGIGGSLRSGCEDIGGGGCRLTRACKSAACESAVSRRMPGGGGCCTRVCKSAGGVSCKTLVRSEESRRANGWEGGASVQRDWGGGSGVKLVCEALVQNARAKCSCKALVQKPRTRKPHAPVPCSGAKNPRARGERQPCGERLCNVLVQNPLCDVLVQRRRAAILEGACAKPSCKTPSCNNGGKRLCKAPVQNPRATIMETRRAKPSCKPPPSFLSPPSAAPQRSAAPPLPPAPPPPPPCKAPPAPPAPKWRPPAGGGAERGGGGRARVTPSPPPYIPPPLGGAPLPLVEREKGGVLKGGVGGVNTGGVGASVYPSPPPYLRGGRLWDPPPPPTEGRLGGHSLGSPNNQDITPPPQQ